MILFCYSVKPTTILLPLPSKSWITDVCQSSNKPWGFFQPRHVAFQNSVRRTGNSLSRQPRQSLLRTAGQSCPSRPYSLCCLLAVPGSVSLGDHHQDSVRGQCMGNMRRVSNRADGEHAPCGSGLGLLQHYVRSEYAPVLFGPRRLLSIV